VLWHMNQRIFASSYQSTRYHVRTQSASTQPRVHQTLHKYYTSLYTRIRENLLYRFKQLRAKKKIILPSIKHNIFKPLLEEHDYVGARLRPAPLSRCRLFVASYWQINIPAISVDPLPKERSVAMCACVCV
jgi:hypothetical protein